jgi:hypothetical protein
MEGEVSTMNENSGWAALEEGHEDLEDVISELEGDEQVRGQVAVLEAAELGRKRLFTDLRERRRALGLSQVELARRIGTSQPAIARLEAGLADPKLIR